MLCNCSNVTVHRSDRGGRGGDDRGVEILDSLDVELLNATFRPPMEFYVAPGAEGEYSRRNEKESGGGIRERRRLKNVSPFSLRVP